MAGTPVLPNIISATIASPGVPDGVTTTIPVNSVTNWPAISGSQYIKAQILDTSVSPPSVKEFVNVTAVNTGASTLLVQRGSEESTRYTPAALAAGLVIVPVLTASVFADMMANVNLSTQVSSVTRARVRQNTTGQTLTGAAWTKVTFDTVETDSDALWDATNNRYVIKQAGTYNIQGMIGVSANATGIREAGVWKNGVNTGTMIGGNIITPASGIVMLVPVVTGPVQLAAGDYIELAMWQNSGGNLTSASDSGLGSYFGIERIDAGVIASGIGGSQLLAAVSATTVNNWVTTTATTYTDIDPSNLVVTFVAPASGRVLIEMMAATYNSATGGGVMWVMRDNVTNAVVAGPQEVSVAAGSTSNWLYADGKILVSGLTAGQVYTWKWSMASATSGITAGTWAGNANDPAILTVRDAGIGTPNFSFPQNGINQPFLAVNSVVEASDLTTTSTSYVKADATNAKVTFIVPASGRVLITIGAVVTSSSGSMTWGVGQTAAVEQGAVATQSASQTQIDSSFLITGLTPGQQVTYYVWFANGSGATSTIKSNSSAPLMITVQDAAVSPNMTAQSPNPFLLGSKTYNPATAGQVSTASTTLVAVDTTNLTITFVAPASGNVLVRLNATAAVSTAGSSGAHWGLLSGGAAIGNTVQLTTLATGLNFTVSIPVTGLTPGQAYTFQWAHLNDTGGAQLTWTRYGGGTTGGSGFGPAVMEVWDGTAGQGTVQTPPGLTTLGRFIGRTTANQATTNNTAVKVTGFTVSDDPLGRWDATNSRWTAPVAATYLLGGAVGFTAAAGGARQVSIYVNGAVVGAPFEVLGGSGDPVWVPISKQLRLNAGDYVEVWALQDSGGTTPQIAAGTELTIMQIPDTSHVPSATSVAQVVGSRLYLAANTSNLVAATWTSIGSWTLDFDSGGFYSSSTPTRLTVPAGGGGRYQVRVQASIPAAGSGALTGARVLVNGVDVADNSVHSSSANWTYPGVERILTLNPGDYVEAQVYSSAVQPVNGAAAGNLTFFELIRMNSVAAANASAVTVSPSGFTTVTHTNVQQALADLDAAGGTFLSEANDLYSKISPTNLPAATDAHAARVASDLGIWYNWLAGKPGFIGEIGWPQRGKDAAEWAALAEYYLQGVDSLANQIWLTVWGTELGQPDVPFDTTVGPNYYQSTKYNRLAIYGHTTPGTNLLGPIGKLTRGSHILEAHFASKTVNRYGVMISAGANGYVGTTIVAATLGRATPYNPGPTHQLTASPDNYLSVELNEYNYGTLFAPANMMTTPQFLASRGVGIVRLPIRWERVQPTLGGALSTTELARIDAAVAAYNAVGIKVILNIHNWGYYFISDTVGATASALGSASVTQAHFVDLWTKMATHYVGMAGVLAYELMNEPAGVATAASWQTISQAAFNAIIAIDTATTIIVDTGGGGDYANLRNVGASHPGGPWITGDTHNQARYTSHHYWDYTVDNSSGQYTQSYQANVIASENVGYRYFTSPSIGSPSQLVPTRRKTGRWSNPKGITRSTASSVTAGSLYFNPIHLERYVAIDALGINWTTAPTAGQIRLGIYADDGNGQPTGAPLLDTGLVTAATVAGWQAATFTAYAPGTGRFHLAFLMANNITGSPGVTSYSPMLDDHNMGSGSPAGAMYLTAQTTTLPTISADVLYTLYEFWPMVSYRVNTFS